MDNSQSSQGGRRIVSASSAKASSRRGSSKKAAQARVSGKQPAEESKAGEYGEYLPEIQSSRSFAQSKASGRESLARASASSKSTRVRRAYELGEQTQIIQAAALARKSGGENSRSSARNAEGEAEGRQRSQGRHIDDEDIDIQANFEAEAYATQPIDFHGVLRGEERPIGGGGQGSSGSAARRTSGKGGGGSGLGSGLLPRRDSQLGATGAIKGRPIGKVNAWESFEVNQFKVRNQAPGAIIEKLRALTAQPIPCMCELPPAEELDSTDPLDSFLEAIQKIMSKGATDLNDEVRRGIHLATGTRTEYCEALLTFICHHQKLETAFGDSVEFFMESLTSVVKLEEENTKMKQSISQLLSLKEDGILVKFSLEKRLKQQIHNVDKITEREKQSQNKIKQLQKQLADKGAECDSLQYRLKHFEEITGMAEPPANAPQSAGVASGGGAVPNPAEEDPQARQNDSQHQGPALDPTFESLKLQELKTLNKKMEEELAQLREATALKDSTEHSHKIQDLFNQLQIENKNLRIYNQKCESKLESKQNLLHHLEDKVTQVMVDKEEAVIQLKSEIVLQKNKLELNEEKFQTKLEMQQKKLEFGFKQQYDEKIKGLEGEVFALEKQRKDLRKRLTRLQGEHEELRGEFTKFRIDKEEQAAARNGQYQDLQKQNTEERYEDGKKQEELQERIARLENDREVARKENDILQRRLKYLKQSTATLAKQKVFLFETLVKGKGEIHETLAKMENAMLADNNNQAYLVSVEKCIKQAKKMADMGTDALQNITQILEFLKIEQLHRLLSDEGELQQLTRDLMQEIHDDGGTLTALAEQQMAQRAVGSTGKATGSPREGDTLQGRSPATGPATTGSQRPRAKQAGADGAQGSAQAQTTSLPAQQRGAAVNQGGPPAGQHASPLVDTQLAPASKNQEYYLNNCPIELASTSVKLLVDVLVQLGVCATPEEAPASVSELLHACNQKSDLSVEQEIQERFLRAPKVLIDEKIAILRAFARQEQELARSTDPDQPRLQQHAEDLLGNSGTQKQKPAGLPQQSHILGVLEGEAVPSRVAHGQRDTPARTVEGNSHDSKEERNQTSGVVELARLEVAKLQSKLEEQKLKSRHLQLNLAGKIVVLEEQLEQATQVKEDHTQQLERAHQEELRRITGGVEQREAQLLQLCEEYREEARDLQFKLETSWRPAEESKTIQKLEKGARGNLYKLMKDEYERLFRKNSELLANYQASIDAFVFLREDLRGSFALAFDCERLDDGLLTMLNEAMLKYYLSKAFGLDKSKFRFLRSEQLYEKRADSREARGSQAGRILKLVIEVVAEDPGQTAQLFKQVKAQIKDGTSLLYDFRPLYFGMNLGSSGFSTHHCLKDFALLSKTGQVIDGEDFVVSVLRNKEQPLIFKILAFNLELREEFMMELSEADIYELVEGDQQLLRNLEPDGLVKKIATNLSVIVRDKIKVLTCEQKIFFNDIWMRDMESGKNQQVHVRSPMEAQLFAADEAAQHRLSHPLQSALTHTAARTSQLSRLQPKHVAPPQAFLDRFHSTVACQTDFEISTLYEGFENVYRGVQKVGEVTHMRLSIQESSKTKTLVFIFDDLTSLQKLKFSLYQKAATDQYVVHSECMRIAEGHHVLVSVEQIQEQGLLIKMYDLLECTAVSFSLLRKQNGQFSKLEEERALDLLMEQDFRNFIYELTFITNKQANESLMQGMRYLFRGDQTAQKTVQQVEAELAQKRQMEALKRESVFKKQTAGRVLPRRKRAAQANRLYSFSQRAFYRDKWTGLAATSRAQLEGAAAHSNELEARTTTGALMRPSGDAGIEGAAVTDWRDSLRERGALLYRNVFTLRCVFDGAEETAQEGVITLYLKDESVNIEVALYKELSKMSIASTVHAQDLFGDDPMAIPFRERIGLLTSMMEKFFVVSEGPIYHMKVESDAVPVQVWLEEKREQASRRNPKEHRAREQVDRYDALENAQAISAIRVDKEARSTPPNGTRYTRITNIDGEMHDLEMIFHKDTPSTKKDGGKSKGGGRQGKKLSTYGKSQQEVAQMQIEQYLEETCPEWDSVYFEISDSQQAEPVAALFDKRRLSDMLAVDEYFDWASALAQVDPLFLDYIQRSLKVDKAKGEVRLHNKENVEQNIMEKYRRAVGGKYLMRQDLGLTSDEERLVSKILIANREAEMCEFLYDIKIFQIQKISNKDLVAYQLEIFTLNDPDVAYQYTYPMNFSAETQDPHTLIIDVINLVEHPLKKEKGAPRQRSRLSERAAGQGGSGVGGQASGSAGQAAHHPRTGSGQGGSALGGADSNSNRQGPLALGQATFQQLFRKYIDNRLVLFIQETRFPRRLEFCLTEPCSQLVWRHHVEPRMITTGTASLHLVDQATLEMFLAVLLDENENCGQHDDKAFEQHAEEPGMEGLEPDSAPCLNLEFVDNWAGIIEATASADQHHFVRDQAVPGTDLAISVCKRRRAFAITLRIVDQDRADNAEFSDKLSSGKASGALEYRADPHAGDSTLAKVVREHGLNYSAVLVKTLGDLTVIKVVSLSPTGISTRFKFTFLDERTGDMASDSDVDRSVSALDGSSLHRPDGQDRSGPAFTTEELQTSTVDALRRYYGTQTMEQALRLVSERKELLEIAKDSDYEPPTIFEKMLDEQPSVHKTRMISNYLRSLDSRSVVLHRKRFFDDQQEKLIIMSVHLKYYQKEGEEANFEQDLDAFTVVLMEPESGQEALYQTPLDCFLTQDEFVMEAERGSFRDKNELKRLARMLLEERVEIRRLESNEMDDTGAAPLNQSSIVGRGEDDSRISKPKRITNNSPQILKDHEAQYTFEIVFDREVRNNQEGEGILGDLANTEQRQREEMMIIAQHEENGEFTSYFEPDGSPGPERHILNQDENQQQQMIPEVEEEGEDH